MNHTVAKQCKANYKRLLDLLPDMRTLEAGTALKMRANQFMDLSIEVLEQSDLITQISMTHYYEQNGDLVPDPDMQVMLMHDMHAALPVHFQNALAYRVCIEDMKIIDSRQFADQSSFLGMWLRNIKAQGHKRDAVEALCQPS